MAITYPPVHTVERIDRSDIDGIIKAIAHNGCCIVKNFTDAATVAKVNEETRPYLDADKPWKVSICEQAPAYKPASRVLVHIALGRSVPTRDSKMCQPGRTKQDGAREVARGSLTPGM